MKSRYFLMACIIAAVVFTACEMGNSFSISTADGVTTVSITNDEGRLRAEYSGDITLTDDETAISTISEGGFLRYEKNGVGFQAKNVDGQIQYKFYDDNKKMPFDDKAKKVLSNGINELINVGFDAKGRVSRLYKKGGTDGVLNAISYLRSDFVKRTYFEHLAEINTLSQNDWIAIAKQIDEQMGSDYEKGQLLQEMASNYIANDEAYKAYIDAVATIGSDYEKANAIKKIITFQLNNNQLVQTLDVTASIGSDYEKANTLKEINKKGMSSEDGSLKFLEVTNGIGSDFEKANVLKEYINNTTFTTPVFNKMIHVTAEISSDDEKANVLKDAALANLSSDEEWISLINGAESVSSNFEKSNVLIEIANRMPGDDKIKTCYMEATKTLTSDMEYANAVKAIRN